MSFWKKGRTFADLPKGWSIGSGYWVDGKEQPGGFVWRGKKPADWDDYDALWRMMGEDVIIDANSTVGTDDPDWTTNFYIHNKPVKPSGWGFLLGRFK